MTAGISSRWTVPTAAAITAAGEHARGTRPTPTTRAPRPPRPTLFSSPSEIEALTELTQGNQCVNWRYDWRDDHWTKPLYDPKTGLYKDCSIGDTPKIFTIDVDEKPTKIVGAGCKNGGFYILRADNGKLVKHTPIYCGAKPGCLRRHV